MPKIKVQISAQLFKDMKEDKKHELEITSREKVFGNISEFNGFKKKN